MKKMNFIAFAFFISGVCLLAYFIDIDELATQEKPWHMRINDHGEDFLATYGNQYKILDKKNVHASLDSTEKKIVLVLVDAWGVSYEKSRLETEFAFFKNVANEYALHVRIKDYTKSAERIEFRTNRKGIYLFGGDSLEYNRKGYMPELGYDSLLFCQKCPDSLMLKNLDSVLSLENMDVFAVTLQSSRYGDAAKLQASLRLISQFMEAHPNCRFVVQGTHRPVLVPAQIRENFYEHLVPVVIKY